MASYLCPARDVPCRACHYGFTITESSIKAAGAKKSVEPLTGQMALENLDLMREGPVERGTCLNRKLMELQALEGATDDRLHR